MILTELESRVTLDRRSFLALSEAELAEVISKAQGFYFHGLAASRAGEEPVARSLYRKAFELLPTHIEALDNCAIGLVEELRFAEAIPLLEQSAVAEPTSPLAFLYLTKCYQETGQNRLAFHCIQYLAQNWPDKSPTIDWSHLGQPQPQQPLVAPPFSEGQVWNFQSQPMEDSARIWIRLVDPERDGHPVVHISVVNTSPSDDSRRWLISHLPFDPAALSESSLTLTDERQRWDLEEDDFGSGYAIWREAFDFGKAGVFTEPVPAVVYTLLQQAK